MKGSLICGIDEAGRGPLAGPVYAASVVLGDDVLIDLLNDSKKLSPAKREKLEIQIKEKSFAWGIGWATHEEIDQINILQASLLAMKRSFEKMMEKIKENVKISVIVDGNKTPCLSVPCTALVKADTTVPEVMAASILAKTARDSYMKEMAVLYPQYQYEQHKGYPTKAHFAAIKEHGPSPIQRLTFCVKKD